MRGLPRKYEAQLVMARARLTVIDEVGLALRDHRRRLGLSQRRYAARRGLSRSMVARLEAGAGHLSLDTVVAALEGTGFALVVGFDPNPPDGPEAAAGDDGTDEPVGKAGAALAVHPTDWLPTDLIARVRGGSRRFPAHRNVMAVSDPPIWWWMHEFFNGPSEEPQWYAPVPRGYGREEDSPADAPSDSGVA